MMHQQLGYARAHRLKDLHLYASGVTEITVPEGFQCDVYDATKMVATINREPSIRTTVPGAGLHTNFWGPYPIASIIGGCKMFVTLIDKTTRRVRLRPIASKSEMKGFFIYEVRALIVEDRKPVVVIRTDNARECVATEQALNDMGVSVEFVSTYKAYQNGISERFNRTVATITRVMLNQCGLPMSF